MVRKKDLASRKTPLDPANSLIGYKSIPPAYITGKMKTNPYVVDQISQFIPFNPVIYTRLAMVSRDFYGVFTSDKLWRHYDLYSVKTGIFRDFLDRLAGYQQEMILAWYAGFSDSEAASVFSGIRSKIMELPNWYLRLGCAFNNCFLVGAPQPGSFNAPTFFAFVELVFNREDREATFMPEMSLNTCVASSSLDFYTECPQNTRFGDKCLHHLVKAKLPRDNALPDELTGLAHSLMVHPRLINWQFGVNEGFQQHVRMIIREIAHDRNTLLLFMEGMPEFLDLVPEYWNDREICSRVFRGFSNFSQSTILSPFQFLQECQFPDIIAEAVESIQFREFNLFPECLLEDKESFLRALKAIRADVYEMWLLDRKLCESELWNDPDALATFVDTIYHDSSAEGVIKIPQNGQELLESLCDNYDWMVQRVCVQPASWYLASDRLKREKGLFRHVLSTMKLSRQFTWAPVQNSFNLQFRSKNPAAFYSDEHLVEESVMALGLSSIPKSMWTEDLVRYHVRFGPKYNNPFQQEKPPYRLARAAVLADIRGLADYLWALPSFAGDPTISPYLCDHIEDVYFIVVCRIGQEDLFRKAFDTLVRNAQSMRKTMDPKTSARLLQIDTGIHKKNGFPVDTDVAMEFIKQMGPRTILEIQACGRG